MIESFDSPREQEMRAMTALRDEVGRHAEEVHRLLSEIAVDLGRELARCVAEVAREPRATRDVMAIADLDPIARMSAALVNAVLDARGIRE